MTQTMKFTRHTLKKLESIFDDLDYSVRYEKGTFQSGYCLLEDTKIVVINKFYDVESRINTLLDILSGILVDTELLSDENLRFYKKYIAEQLYSNS